MYNIANQHLQRGWSVVPIPHGKKHPDIPWIKFQTQKPTDFELAHWFLEEPWKTADRQERGPCHPEQGACHPERSEGSLTPAPHSQPCHPEQSEGSLTPHESRKERSFVGLRPPQDDIGEDKGQDDKQSKGQDDKQSKGQDDKQSKRQEDNSQGDKGESVTTPNTQPRSRHIGIGVVCGAVSDNLVCLDFDFRHAFYAWYEVHKGLYDLPIAKSPRGYHVFFRTEEPIPSGKFGLEMSLDRVKEILAEKGIRPDQVKLEESDTETGQYTGPVGDLISDGKLVVIPPTTHPLGREREWIKEPGETVPTVSLKDIGVLRWPPSSETGSYTPRPCPEGPFTEGSRHQALLSVASRLHRARVSFAVLKAALESVNELECVPPLPAREVDKIALWAHNLPDNPGPARPSGQEEESMEIKTLHLPASAQRISDRGGAIGVLHVYGPEDVVQAEEAFQPCDVYLESEQEEDVPWLVEGFMPQGYLVVLGGTSKAGKTCFVTAMSMAIANGEPFLGLPTQEGAVLWSCYEESKSERAYTLKQYASRPNNLFITHERPMIDQPEGQRILRHWVEKTGARLLVIDPLYGANEAQSLTDGKSARNALQGLKDLCNETGVTAIVIHHFTKNVGAGLVRERLADSNQIVAVASMDVLMDAEEEAGGSRLIRLKCKGRGVFANQTWIVRSKGMTDFELVENGQTVSVEAIQRDRAIVEFLESIAHEALSEGRPVEGLTSNEIAEKTGFHPKTLQNLAPRLCEAGILAEVGKRGRWKLYASASAAVTLPQAS